jgi:hypothetical protein
MAFAEATRARRHAPVQVEDEAVEVVEVGVTEQLRRRERPASLVVVLKTSPSR